MIFASSSYAASPHLRPERWLTPLYSESYRRLASLVVRHLRLRKPPHQTCFATIGTKPPKTIRLPSTNFIASPHSFMRGSSLIFLFAASRTSLDCALAARRGFGVVAINVLADIERIDGQTLTLELDWFEEVNAPDDEALFLERGTSQRPAAARCTYPDKVANQQAIFKSRSLDTSCPHVSAPPGLRQRTSRHRRLLHSASSVG